MRSTPLPGLIPSSRTMRPSGDQSLGVVTPPCGLVRCSVASSPEVAEIELVEVEQIAMPLLPCPALDVRGQTAKPLVALLGRDRCVGRYPGSYPRIQVGFWAPPERSVEAVDTVVRDRNGENPAPPQGGGDVCDRHCLPSVEIANAGKVLADQPERLPDLLIPAEDHDATPRYPTHLSQAPGRVGPVMQREYGKGGVHGVIGEG